MVLGRPSESEQPKHLSREPSLFFSLLSLISLYQPNFLHFALAGYQQRVGQKDLVVAGVESCIRPGLCPSERRGSLDDRGLAWSVKGHIRYAVGAKQSGDTTGQRDSWERSIRGTGSDAPLPAGRKQEEISTRFQTYLFRARVPVSEDAVPLYSAWSNLLI
ncbi:hypothetical protein HAX54_024849 [Datura stramonium]|uniref:Uncharacterized protein n=1 Tax=Datura stramonium TaxID=4076 RepID=A0ABS8V0K2_DATST|nr:hypothetical protein [Datura stramonium]